MMSPVKRRSLLKWITEARANRDLGNGTCNAIGLFHLVGMQPQEVFTQVFKANVNYDDKQLANDFNERAHGHCQDMLGPQMFQLQAFYNTNEALDRCPFTVDPIGDPNRNMGSEGPSESGQRQMTMRQAEAVFQQAYRKQEHLDRMHTGLIELLGRQLMESMAAQKGASDMLLQVLVDKARIENEQTEKHLKMERETSERKQFLGMIPPLLNTVTGQDVFPQNSADSAIINAIAGNITEDNLEQVENVLAAMLPPALLGPLKARIVAQMKEKREVRAQIIHLPKPKLNPLDDIGGGQNDTDEEKDPKKGTGQ